MRQALGWPPASLRVRNPLVGHLELQVLHCVDACPGPSCPQVNLLLSDAAFPRRSNTVFGIWDLPQKSSTKAKFGTLGLNWDFFGTIFIPFWDF